MADHSTRSTGGIGFFGVLLIVFITLKLCGVIQWSWFWVLSPFWIPLGLAAALLLVAGFCVLVAYMNGEL